MAARPPHAVSRLAVERARARMPELAPDSVEIVELRRGRPYVVVRTTPSGLLVLDERGRLVRGRDRLAAVARHLDGVERVGCALDQALLDRRCTHAERSIALLERQLGRARRGAVPEGIAALVASLGGLRGALDALQADVLRRRARPPTERTLRRTVGLLNAAARADRAVVLSARRLGEAAGRLEDGAGGRPGSSPALRRWLAARLASPDLPFFYGELDERESERFVEAFVAAART